MIVGLSGWMDGGQVSTGTVEYLARRLRAEALAEIPGDDFYILNIPGPMDVAALFRPHAKIEDGLVTECQLPRNLFLVSRADNLIFMLGKEPNLKWTDYARCVFSVAKRFGVERIYFLGSVSGLAPHSRDPRLMVSVSDESLKPELDLLGAPFSDYEGPGHLCTYLTHLAGEYGIGMINLIAQIPVYVHGVNYRCVESLSRKLAGLLKIHLDLTDLRLLTDEQEERIDAALTEHPELAERVRQLEDDYDSGTFETEMGDLKTWLEQHGLKLD
jgi:proteasome assembly chaperone (PAC2) family protein